MVVLTSWYVVDLSSCSKLPSSLASLLVICCFVVRNSTVDRNPLQYNINLCSKAQLTLYWDCWRPSLCVILQGNKTREGIGQYNTILFYLVCNSSAAFCIAFVSASVFLCLSTWCRCLHPHPLLPQHLIDPLRHESIPPLSSVLIVLQACTPTSVLWPTRVLNTE